MGCNQSKIENEEAVSRCKERKQHMKDAVAARNAFAAAHSSYSVSLKNTGAALSDFASGESLLPHLTHSASAPASFSPLSPPEPPIFSTLQPPPPPIPAEMEVRPPVPLRRGPASSSPLPPPEPSTFSTLPPPPPPIPAEMEVRPPGPRPPVPLQRAQSMPEIPVSKAIPNRSETIVEEEKEDDEEVESEVHSLKRRSSGRRGGGVRVVEEEDRIRPPPTPPPDTPPPPVMTISNRPPPPPAEVEGSTWDYFINVDDMPGGSLGVPDQVSRESEDVERKVHEVRAKRAEIDSPVRKMEDLPPKVPEQVAVAVDPGAGGAEEGKRTGRSVSLNQIFKELDDCFLQSSESAHDVSKMLETVRLHYHSSFANSCGHINHSEKVMKVITWNRSFKRLQNNDDGKDDFESEENETHASVLDKL